MAVADKFYRTKTALQNGADLVIELPSAYATANAQRFAWCGVHIAKSFDCVNFLAFGCETDDIKVLKACSSATENQAVQEIINAEMKNGNYYPRALEFAVREVYGDKIADVITSPNNILAVEYIKNLNNSSVKPLPIMRVGVNHDSHATNGDFASASQLRELLRNNENLNSFAPNLPNDITYPENLERAILYKLRTMSIEDFKELPDVGEGLENRIFEAVRKYNSIKEILVYVKTKRYTHARLRRILANALLGVTEELQNTPVEYARVLGFNNAGAELLKDCKLEVVTSVAKGLKLGGNIEKLLKLDVLATDVSALAYNEIHGMSRDFTNGVVKIN